MYLRLYQELIQVAASALTSRDLEAGYRWPLIMQSPW